MISTLNLKDFVVIKRETRLTKLFHEAPVFQVKNMNPLFRSYFSTDVLETSDIDSEFEKELATIPVTNTSVTINEKIPTIPVFIKVSPNNRAIDEMNIRIGLKEMLSQSVYQYDNNHIDLKIYIIKDSFRKNEAISSEEKEYLQTTIGPILLNLYSSFDLFRNKVPNSSPLHKSYGTMYRSIQSLYDKVQEYSTFRPTSEDERSRHPLPVYITAYIKHLKKNNVFKATIDPSKIIYGQLSFNGVLREKTFVENGIYINTTREDLLSIIKERELSKAKESPNNSLSKAKESPNNSPKRIKKTKKNE